MRGRFQFLIGCDAAVALLGLLLQVHSQCVASCFDAVTGVETILIHQNEGKLGSKRRDRGFAQLADDEAELAKGMASEAFPSRVLRRLWPLYAEPGSPLSLLQSGESGRPDGIRGGVPVSRQLYRSPVAQAMHDPMDSRDL